MLQPDAILTTVELTNARRSAHWCASCDSTDIERSHPRGLSEHVVYYLLHRRRYRCRDCGSKFYDRPSEASRVA